MRPYPRLQVLFGAYFHQDWDSEGADWPALVANFQRDTSTQEVDATADELEAFLRSEMSDEALQRWLWHEFGCAYDPRPDLGGPSVRQWLQEVFGALRHQV